MACDSFRGGERLKRWRSRSGHSLAELLVVLALLSLLSLAVFPALGPVREERLLKATAETIAMHMRLAQGHAVAENAVGKLVFYELAGIYYIDLTGQPRQWVYLPEELSIIAINFPIVYNRRELSFNPLGVPSQGGHVGLGDSRGSRIYVIITPVTGRVRISRTPP